MEKKRCAGTDEEEEEVLHLLLVPEEVLIQHILVRLPVVSLLRFKAVSKSWCALIQTSYFIHLHTTFNSSSSKQLGGDIFILQASQGEVSESESDFLMFSCEEAAAAAGYESDDDKKKKKKMKSDDDDDKKKKKKKSDEDDNDDDDEVGFKLDKLEPPHSIVKTDSYNSTFTRLAYMAGSCNGLICLRNPYYNDVFLWNPATRQSRILPKPSLPTESYNVFSDLVAFGLDLKTNDYKVLLITCFNPKYTSQTGPLKCLCRVQVYSLSTNSWRHLERINSLPGVPCQERSLRHPGIYLNGSYFFVGCKIYLESIFSENSLTIFHKSENSLIMSFDFTREIFTTMRFPLDHHDDVVQRRWYLSCLGGDKLALFAIRDYREYEDCDVWVLNEQHGPPAATAVIKESWTRLHFFQIQRNGASERTLPRGILNNGEFALLETRFYADEEKKKRFYADEEKEKKDKKKKMQLYNLVTKEAKTDFLVCSRVKTVEVYKPSLISIIGGNGAAAAAAAATDRVIGGAI